MSGSARPRIVPNASFRLRGFLLYRAARRADRAEVGMRRAVAALRRRCSCSAPSRCISSPSDDVRLAAAPTPVAHATAQRRRRRPAIRRTAGAVDFLSSRSSSVGMTERAALLPARRRSRPRDARIAGRRKSRPCRTSRAGASRSRLLLTRYAEIDAPAAAAFARKLDLPAAASGAAVHDLGAHATRARRCERSASSTRRRR